MLKKVIMMKKWIKCAEDDSKIEKDSSNQIDSFKSRAKRLEYELNIDDNICMTMKATNNADKLPIIDIATDMIDKNTYEFYPCMICPALDSIDFSANDEFEYWPARWAEIGKLLSDIRNYRYTTLH